MMAAKDGSDTRRVFRYFTKTNGLQDDEFNTSAFAKLSNGNLAFGGVNDLNIFNPQQVLASSFEPNVFITSLSAPAIKQVCCKTPSSKRSI